MKALFLLLQGLLLSSMLFSLDNEKFKFEALLRSDTPGFIYEPVGWDDINIIKFFPDHDILITFDRKANGILHNLRENSRLKLVTYKQNCIINIFDYTDDDGNLLFIAFSRDELIICDYKNIVYGDSAGCYSIDISKKTIEDLANFNYPDNKVTLFQDEQRRLIISYGSSLEKKFFYVDFSLNLLKSKHDYKASWSLLTPCDFIPQAYVLGNMFSIGDNLRHKYIREEDLDIYSVSDKETRKYIKEQYLEKHEKKRVKIILCYHFLPDGTVFCGHKGFVTKWKR